MEEEFYKCANKFGKQCQLETNTSELVCVKSQAFMCYQNIRHAQSSRVENTCLKVC